MSENNPFHDILLSTLKDFGNPDLLGKSSPLSSSYFLGSLMPSKRDITDEGKGQLLQEVLLEAAAKLWEGHLPPDKKTLEQLAIQDRDKKGNLASRRYHYWLLELCYFRRYYSERSEPKKIEDIPHFVGISRSPFYTHRKLAIKHLAEQLSTIIQPSFRLESPQLGYDLIGRDPIIKQIVTALKADRMVALTGLGGVGKTSLGVAIKSQWQWMFGDVFWYTIRPYLNNSVESFLFALSHFLNGHGQSRLWMQMVGRRENESNQLDVLIGLLKEDLKQLETTPLLCIDEIDLMGQGYMDDDLETWQFIDVIDSLKTLCPFLLIGQRSLLDTDEHYHLSGLNVVQMTALFRMQKIDLAHDKIKKIHRATKGNPRLIQLYIALFQAGETASDIFTLGQHASTQPLLMRLWRHLDDDERQMFRLLSVFRGIVPESAWEAEETINKLIGRTLLQRDERGGVALIPTFRQLMYNNLSGEQREKFHAIAATIREKFGQYTASAYHYVRSGCENKAVKLWFSHKEIEINLGEGTTALDLFNQISSDNLTSENRKLLALIRQQLHLLRGNIKEALDVGNNVQWGNDHVDSEFYKGKGIAYQTIGDEERVIENHTQSITILGKLIHDMIDCLRRRGNARYRIGQIDFFKQDVQKAEQFFTFFKGCSYFWTGEYPEAKKHLLFALTLARLIDDTFAVADTCRWLAIVANHQGDEPAAKQFSAEAIDNYQQIGDLLNAESVRTNLAGMMIQLRRFDEAINSLESSLMFYEQIGADSWMATTLVNLAECYLETGQAEKAEKAVFRAYQMENIAVQPYALHIIGLLHEKREAYDLAEVAFQQGIEIVQENEGSFLLAYLLRGLGRILGKVGRSDEAKMYFNQAIALFQKMSLQYEIDATKGLYEDNPPSQIE